MSDTVLVALISGAVSLLVNFGTRWLDSRNGITKDLKDIKEDVAKLQSNYGIYGDMVYQILDHMATNNNSGEMKRALDEYNTFFRKK